MFMIKMMHLWEAAAMAILTCLRITKKTPIQVKTSSTRLTKSKTGQQTLCIQIILLATQEKELYLCLLSTKILELLNALNYNRILDDKKALLTWTTINIEHCAKKNFSQTSSCLPPAQAALWPPHFVILNISKYLFSKCEIHCMLQKHSSFSEDCPEFYLWNKVLQVFLVARTNHIRSKHFTFVLTCKKK